MDSRNQRGCAAYRCQVRGWQLVGIRADDGANWWRGHISRLPPGTVVLQSFPRRVVVLAHLAVFATSVVAGWSTAEGALPGREVGAARQEAMAIAVQNVRAACVLAVASLVTAGFGGIVFFAVNGHAFGRMLGIVPLQQAPWVLLYAPVEVWAFTVASVAAARLSWDVARWLHGEPWSRTAVWRAGRAMAGMAGMLGAAAILETFAILGAWGDG